MIHFAMILLATMAMALSLLTGLLTLPNHRRGSIGHGHAYRFQS